MVISKQKRELYRRRFTNFWVDFSHNKIGFLGLIIIIAFIAGAALAPILTPYLPSSLMYRSERLAVRYAAPGWFVLFPQYSDYNPTIKLYPNLAQAKVLNQSGLIEINLDERIIKFATTGKESQKASVTLDLGNFSYTYSSPPEFRMESTYWMYSNRTKLTVYFIIQNFTQRPTWNDYFKDPTKAEMEIGSFTPPPEKYAKTNYTVNELGIESYTYKVTQSLFDFTKLKEAAPRPSSIIFSEKGVYGLRIKFEFKSVSPYEGARAELKIGDVGFIVWGRMHGIFGTDFGGNDAWTELIYGARVSLMVGVLAALIGTGLGIFYGVLSGYLGGFVDEFLMRIVDVLLCIPVLPILLILMRYFHPNVYFVVVLIAIFGWQGLSRVIRSRVLSLKEMAFIESARASGASDFYIMTRHLIPNVLPIAIAAMVLAVPGAIITEAALSFLGFGDPNAPTWGRMLYHAYQLGGLEAWWVWVPPGLSICALCVGFVFIGHAVDEIINPRLRRRR
jgi:ABC-type dipeptide/oligopeptide/nickel transport system permease subunit